MSGIEPIHPGDRIANRQWQSPWAAWPLAFRTRRSFGHAAGFGALSAVFLILINTIFSLAFNFIWPIISSWIDTSSYPSPRLLGSLLVGMQVSIYATFVFYIASRFADPEIRIWGGLFNLKIWRLLFSVIVVGAYMGLFFYLAFSFFDNLIGRGAFASNPALSIFQIILILILAIYVFQILMTLSIWYCVNWPPVSDGHRPRLSSIFGQPSFHLNQLGLACVNWLGWALASIGSGVAVGAVTISGLNTSESLWIIFFILTPFSFIIISGYSIFVFAAVAVAPFRVAGWTLSSAENVTAIFE